MLLAQGCHGHSRRVHVHASVRHGTLRPLNEPTSNFDAGIEQSHLDLSAAANVYYSGNEQIADNFRPLNWYASDIIGAL